jgi:hypothetical protein
MFRSKRRYEPSHNSPAKKVNSKRIPIWNSIGISLRLQNENDNQILEKGRQKLKSLGLRERKVKGDGNCTFHAISDQLQQKSITVNNPEKKELYIVLRELFRNECRRRCHELWDYGITLSDVDSYGDGIWNVDLSDLVLYVLADTIKVNIRVIYGESIHIFHTIYHEYTEPFIITLLYTGNHYSSTEPIIESTESYLEYEVKKEPCRRCDRILTRTTLDRYDGKHCSRCFDKIQYRKRGYYNGPPSEMVVQDNKRCLDLKKRLGGVTHPKYIRDNSRFAKTLESIPDVYPSEEEETDYSSSSEDEIEELYEVDEIIARRKREGDIEYLIKWKGYDKVKDLTWESRKSLNKHIPEMIEDFEEEYEF